MMRCHDMTDKNSLTKTLLLHQGVGSTPCSPGSHPMVRGCVSHEFVQKEHSASRCQAAVAAILALIPPIIAHFTALVLDPVAYPIAYCRRCPRLPVLATWADAILGCAVRVRIADGRVVRARVGGAVFGTPLASVIEGAGTVGAARSEQGLNDRPILKARDARIVGCLRAID